MNEATITPSTLTIGLDLGDRKSHVCVLDGDGAVVEESRIATTPQALRTRFESLAPTRIALEVGGHSAWVCELLKELGHEALVANARKLRMIFQSDSKNDRLDAEPLPSEPHEECAWKHGGRREPIASRRSRRHPENPATSLDRGGPSHGRTSKRPSLAPGGCRGACGGASGPSRVR